MCAYMGTLQHGGGTLIMLHSGREFRALLLLNILFILIIRRHCLWFCNVQTTRSYTFLVHSLSR